MTPVITQAGAAAAVEELTPRDVPELLAMYDRCSPDTRFARWHGQVREFPTSYLDALLARSDQHIAVVARRGGAVIGLASAASVGPTTRELGILVEDSWQRHGVGRQLLTRLLDECVALGTRYLRAEVLIADARLVDPLRALGPTTVHTSFGVVTATVRLWA